jgi:transcriptional regulator with XRE-family HTH domain
MLEQKGLDRGNEKCGKVTRVFNHVQYSLAYFYWFVKGESYLTRGHLKMAKVNRDKKWGPAITRIREKAGLTKADLARMIDVERGLITQYENGESGLSDSALEAILEACDTTFLEFAATVSKLTNYADNPVKKPTDNGFSTTKKILLVCLALFLIMIHTSILSPDSFANIVAFLTFGIVDLSPTP